MKFSYKEFDQDLLMRRQLHHDLKELYRMLMMHLSGEADRVRNAMEELQERGYISEALDIAAFFQQMEEDRLVNFTKGKYAATARGRLEF